MDNKPSLTQYFGETEPPPATQCIVEIGNTPADMIQSVYLGNDEAKETTSASLFPHTMTTSFSHEQAPLEMTFTSAVPELGGPTAVPATSLPDPSTFFDGIGPEVQIGPVKSTATSSEVLAQVIDGPADKPEQVDKEADRRRDAWIPNDEAKKTLMKAQSSPKGSFFPEREVLTMPGLALEEELPDSLHEASVKYLGVSLAGSRGGGGGVLRADTVPRDEGGLRELLRTGCLRAAINLSGELINAIGQGRIGRQTRHTPRSLQLWLTRLALMVRVKLHEPLVKEAATFGDFSKPDMYYQFYPEVYGDRPGSLVPFSLRVLVAEVPGHVNKPDEAVDKLYALRATVQKMLANLREGKTEDSTGTLSEQDRMESLKLWQAREVRVIHSIVNCAIAMKDYRLATKLLSNLAAAPEADVVSKRLSLSALCRLNLQAGHGAAARAHLQAATVQRAFTCPMPDVREYVDMGLIDIAHGKYLDGYNNFLKAADQEPTNMMVANNSAVCLLYMGKLKEAIQVLLKAINADPVRGLNENLLINLCTLYELESSNTNEKKINLLKMLCKYKSDTMPNVLECLKLA